MPDKPLTHFSRRERQIMDIVYRQGQATAAEVLAALPDPPTYSTVRALLRIHVDKGHLRHEHQGPRYVFLPTLAREKARRSALKGVVQTFFAGSAEQVVATLLDMRTPLSDDELNRLAQIIEQARKEER
jgi:BlaI family transcriptional regulator, penicillinase repressor